jgi:hypothetical protein
MPDKVKAWHSFTHKVPGQHPSGPQQQLSVPPATSATLTPATPIGIRLGKIGDHGFVVVDFRQVL